MASAPPSPAPASPRGTRKRALDPEQVGAFIEKVLAPASGASEELKDEARKLQKKQEQIPFSVLSSNKAYTVSTIDLSGLQDLELPKPPDPSKEPSTALKEYIARIRKYWHLNSSENTTRTLIDVILLEVLHHLPADKTLDVWGEVYVSKQDDLNVYGSIDYILAPSSKDSTPKGRYVIVVEAKNHLEEQDRVQAFGEMKAALKNNKDDLIVYGVLTDAKEWCILSLGPDRVPRISTALLLGTDPVFAEAQLKRLVNMLYAVFILAVTQVKK